MLQTENTFFLKFDVSSVKTLRMTSSSSNHYKRLNLTQSCIHANSVRIGPLCHEITFKQGNNFSAFFYKFKTKRDPEERPGNVDLVSFPLVLTVTFSDCHYGVDQNSKLNKIEYSSHNLILRKKAF